ncbi:MAG: hypothetical protein IJ158_09525 [Treponema sp.]|nr:hypothetical protein [Treponema sp.]
MKKFSKVLSILEILVLCIGGGLLATSCSDDDGEEDKTPSLQITAESVSVTAGDKIEAVITATLTNDSFAGDIEANASLGEYVTITPSTESFVDDLSVTASEAIAAGATSAKVKVSVTTTVAATGTISVTIKASALKSAKDLKSSNTIAYTITEAGAPTYDQSLVYSMDDITTISDTVGDTSLLDGKVVVSQTAAGKIKITANSAGTHHYIQASCGASTTNKPSAQTGYLAVKAAKAGSEKITFTFTTVKSTKGESQNQIAIYDGKDGSQIAISDAITCPTTDDDTEKTLEITATVPETFYVVFVRGAGSGGFKFSKIEQKY